MIFFINKIHIKEIENCFFEKDVVTFMPIGYHFKSFFEIMSLVKSKIYLGMLATLPPSGGKKKKEKMP